MFPIAEIEPQPFFVTKETVNTLHRAVVLLEAERIAMRFSISRIHHQSARSNQGRYHVLVYGKFIFAPGEETEPRMKPMREDRGDIQEAFIDKHFRGVSPWRALPGIAAGDNERTDPVIEGSR